MSPFEKLLWFLSLLWFNFKLIMLILLILIIYILLAAFLTLFERQVLAAIQRRKGPNVVGFMGLFQAIADALKLLFKEQSFPFGSAKTFFIVSSIYIVVLSLIIWAVLPLSYGSVLLDSNIALLYFLSVSGLGVYGIIVAGWSSSSRYPFLGALRACAQLLSYELAMGTSFLIIYIFTGTLNLTEIILMQEELGLWLVFITLPLIAIWFICAVAETYRAPFDLAEAESELVSGFNVEYAGMPFAFLFLGEYLHIVIMSNLITLVFLGGWLPPLLGIPFIDEFFSLLPINGHIWYGIKTVFVIFLFVWVRATFPRFRYDQLMAFGWRVLLPFTCLLLIIAISSVL